MRLLKLYSATDTEGSDLPGSEATFLGFILFTYSLTYLLTPWSRVLLEKLTGFQLAKKFPAFY